MGQLTFQATLGGSINLVGPNTASTVNFTLPSADGSNGQALRTNGSGTLSFGTLAVTAGGTGVTTSTGSGNVVLSTSPTLVTPILGTPTSATLTNATGLPLTTGVTGTLPVANGGTGLTSVGTSGNVLTSNGSAWVSQAVAASKAADTQTFNSSGTWTKPSGYGSSARVFIQVWGGGGGGGDGLAGTNGGGGGGGAYNERWLPLSSLGSTETATVGAGGTRGTSAPGGGNGGTTSLGTLVYAYGGGGGSANGGESNNFGGGGGGQISGGVQGVANTSSTAAVFSGRPWLSVVPRDSSNSAASSDTTAISGNVAGNRSLAGRIYDAFWHGGGGGSRNNNTTGGFGSNSVFGGGGGGAVDQIGGTSQIAGAGGNSPGNAGTAPAGGGAGGTAASSAAGAGAAGRIIVTVFDGA